MACPARLLFEYADTLQSLYLGSNKVARLTNATFTSGTPRMPIEVIDLSSNKLTEITKGVFNTLISLKYLSLKANLLTEVAAGSFTGLFKITQLILDDNRIASMVSAMFQPFLLSM